MVNGIQRPRYKFTYLWIIDFWQRSKKLYNEKIASSTSVTGLTGCLHVENANKLHKTKVQILQRPQHRSGYTTPNRIEGGK